MNEPSLRPGAGVVDDNVASDSPHIEVVTLQTQTCDSLARCQIVHWSWRWRCTGGHCYVSIKYLQSYFVTESPRRLESFVNIFNQSLTTLQKVYMYVFSVVDNNEPKFKV